MDRETPHPGNDLLPEQKGVEAHGGTMRLGAQAVEADRHEEMEARDLGLRGSIVELDGRSVLAREGRGAVAESAHEQLVVLSRRDRLPGDLGHTQVEQLLARVAERLAGELVDGDVA